MKKHSHEIKIAIPITYLIKIKEQTIYNNIIKAIPRAVTTVY